MAAITACTENPYTVDLVGYLPGTGQTVGSIVTFDTPPPVWTSETGEVVLQCQSVALGGFNGLNN
jgi:hypothetical protein